MKLPDIQVSVPLTLTHAEQLHIGQNSVERMINTTLKLLEHLPDDDLVDTNHQDWEELKWTVIKLWSATQNAIFVTKATGRQD